MWHWHSKAERTERLGAGAHQLERLRPHRRLAERLHVLPRDLTVEEPEVTRIAVLCSINNLLEPALQPRALPVILSRELAQLSVRERRVGAAPGGCKGVCGVSREVHHHAPDQRRTPASTQPPCNNCDAIRGLIRAEVTTRDTAQRRTCRRENACA